MTLRRFHRVAALGLAGFLLLHLLNHLAGLGGQQAHGVVQTALRLVYRHPLVEPVLLIAVAAQALSGLAMAGQRLRRQRPRRDWHGAQTLAGLYLAMFMAIHVSAVLAARAQGGETDLAFAATAFQAGGPWPWLFAPYYGLAVWALGLHLAAPLSRRRPRAAVGLTLTTGAMALVLVLLLAGVLTPISIPAAQIAAFPLMP